MYGVRDEGQNIEYWLRKGVEYTRDKRHGHGPLDISYWMRRNYERLRDGLLLIRDENAFNMNYWTSMNDGQSVTEVPEVGCDTAACACGWGPIFGIGMEYRGNPTIGAFNYDSYLQETFGALSPHLRSALSVDGEITFGDANTQYRRFLWVFAPKWGSFDNTPRGAAIRIHIMLERGTPALRTPNGGIYDFPDSVSLGNRYVPGCEPMHYPTVAQDDPCNVICHTPVYKMTKPKDPNNWTKHYIGPNSLEKVCDTVNYEPAESWAGSYWET